MTNHFGEDLRQGGTWPENRAKNRPGERGFGRLYTRISQMHLGRSLTLANRSEVVREFETSGKEIYFSATR